MTSPTPPRSTRTAAARRAWPPRRGRPGTPAWACSSTSCPTMSASPPPSRTRGGGPCSRRASSPATPRRSTSTGTSAAAGSGSPCWDRDSDVDALEIKDGELRYYDHRFPLAEGSYTEGDDPREVHDRQHYELVGWRRADNELNYRRFFAVNSLAGIRVELPEVFDEAHAEIVRWFREGLVDGLRIDHPDGLADPEGYLRRLREVTGGSYLLIEKILEPGEVLPAELRLRGHHRLRRPRGRGPALRRPRRAGRPGRRSTPSCAAARRRTTRT